LKLAKGGQNILIGWNINSDAFAALVDPFDSVEMIMKLTKITATI